MAAEIERGQLREIRVDRKVHLVYPARRALSHAAKAFLDVVKGSANSGEIS